MKETPEPSARPETTEAVFTIVELLIFIAILGLMTITVVISLRSIA